MCHHIRFYKHSSDSIFTSLRLHKSTSTQFAFSWTLTSKSTWDWYSPSHHHLTRWFHFVRVCFRSVAVTWGRNANVCSQSAASANGCATHIKQGGKLLWKWQGKNVTAYNIMRNMVSVYQAYTAQRENSCKITRRDCTDRVEDIWTNVSCSIMAILKPYWYVEVWYG